MERILGVEGGGTKTAWALAESRGETQLAVIETGKLPPSNLRLTSREQLLRMFECLPREVDRAGVFLAGCATAEDRQQMRELCARVWSKSEIVVGGDRESGLAAALGEADGIAVNAGTGASVTGRRGDRIEKAGGWGHILGDTGGGYFVALQALRLLLQEYDLCRGERRFVAGVLNALCLNSLDDLVRWAQTADKIDVAMLCPLVFDAAESGDTAMTEIIETGARRLADFTTAVAGRLELPAPEVRLIGGLFEKRQSYVEAFCKELSEELPEASVEVAQRAPELGAVLLALRGQEPRELRTEAVSREEALSAAVTEQPNIRSALLDQMTPRELVELFVVEERHVHEALRACADELAEVIQAVAEALRAGGRLFYLGAGTSGRLGVLDASEIPPTFGAAPDLVQGIIAGGERALHHSVEGAEDDERGGALAVRERQVRSGDFVVGISASGRAPFVIGGLHEASARGAQTMLLTCNPARGRLNVFSFEIDLPTGPEIVTGSTRLKAGTATKVALNIISTGAMVRLGKVRGNVMVDLAATNAKLRDRAIRIVAQEAGCSYEEARQRLEAANWNLRSALRVR